MQPIAVDNGLDRIIHKVNGTICIFLAHHILMSLQNYRRVIFVTRCSGHTHDDIHCVIHYTLYLMRGCKVL